MRTPTEFLPDFGLEREWIEPELPEGWRKDPSAPLDFVAYVRKLGDIWATVARTSSWNSGEPCWTWSARVAADLDMGSRLYLSGSIGVSGIREFEDVIRRADSLLANIWAWSRLEETPQQ